MMRCSRGKRRKINYIERRGSLCPQRQAGMDTTTTTTATQSWAEPQETRDEPKEEDEGKGVSGKCDGINLLGECYIKRIYSLMISHIDQTRGMQAQKCAASNLIRKLCVLLSPNVSFRKKKHEKKYT